MNKGGERSIDIATFAHRDTEGDNHAMFRKVFEIILDDTTTTQPREERIAYLMCITSIFQAFFKSSIFRDGCRPDFSEAKKSFFFRPIARRLWRVQM